MNSANQLTVWQRWVHYPRKLWLRRALFQVHLWSGMILGLYIFVMSVTGSVLVYRNELYRAATQEPIISTSAGPRLTDVQLTEAATHLYSGFRVVKLGRPRNPDQAVDIGLRKDNELKSRLFDPRSGQDLGPAVPLGIWLVSELLSLHDDLLAGPRGRAVNGAGAFALLLLSLTGLAIWWPGIKRWRRSLIVPRGIGWKRWNWHLHSMAGFWTFGFLVIFAVSGVYLCYPEKFQDAADWLEPVTTANLSTRITDRIIYWVAYLHFGRINGIGIPCRGPGVCDQATKAAWATFGLAPALMFVTGAILWWVRVLRPRLKKRASQGLTASSSR